MRKKLLILLIIVPSFVHSQEIVQHKLFSDVIGVNIRSYKKRAKIAYLKKDYERAQYLFDSLVSHVINGSYIDNFKLRKFSGRSIEFYKFEKPIFLITSASWIAVGSGEIPAFNSVVDTYNDQVDFVILFWGPKKKLRKIKRKYSKKVNILYVDEKENTNDHTIRSMKHSLGFPTSFLIAEDKQILDVRRNIHHHNSKDFTTSYNLHFQKFMGSLSVLIKAEVDTTSGVAPIVQ